MTGTDLPIGADSVVAVPAVPPPPLPSPSDSTSSHRAIAWNGAAQMLPQLISFAIAPFVVHRLGIDRFGIWALLLTVIAIIAALDGGIGVSLARFFNLHHAEGDAEATGRLVASAVALFVLASGLVTFGFGLGAPAVVRLLNVPARLSSDAVAMVRCAGPLLALALPAGVFSAVLQAHNRFRAVAAVAVSGAVTYLVVAVILLASGHGLVGLVMATAAQYATMLTLGILLSRGGIRLSRRCWLAPEERTELWRFSSRMQLAGVAGMINNQTDALVVAVFLPVRYVGLYAIGARVGRLAATLPLWAMSPMMIRLSTAFGAGRCDGALREFHGMNDSWQRFVGVYGPVAAVTAGFATRAWFGPGSATAAVVAAILAGGLAVNLSTAPLSCLVRAVGAPGLEMRYGLVTAGLNVVLTVPLAIAFGLYGVATATAASLVVGSACFLPIVRRGIRGEYGPLVRARYWLPGVGAAGVTLALELLVRSWDDAGVPALTRAAIPGFLGLVLGTAVAWRGMRTP